MFQARAERYSGGQLRYASGAQRGFGLALFLVILVLGTVAVLLSTPNVAALKVERDKVTERVLSQAKAALIGRAARDDARPGSLPCPDTDGDGTAELFAGNDCPAYIGFLPWRTLGLPELRDGSGERLWYALSPSFRDHPTAEPINSDKRADIETQSAAGVLIAGDLVALIIAPERALAGQVRPGGSASNYVEFVNPTPPLAGTPPVYTYQLQAGSNDSILPISQRDLFSVVDRAVYTRIRDTIAPKLKALATSTWGIAGTDVNYPFAVPATGSGSPAATLPAGTDPFRGVPGTRWGLLPVEDNASPLPADMTRWNNSPIPNVVKIWGSANLGAATGCSLPTSTRLSCTVEAVGGGWESLVYRIDATVLNAGQRLVAVTPAGTWTPTSTFSSGNAQGRASGSLSGGSTVTITLDIDTVSWAKGPTYASDTSWFFENEWYKQVFYAVAPNLLFGAASTLSCTGPADCLSADNGATYNKGALLVLAGRPLNSAARPTSTLGDYLEAPNVAGTQNFKTQPRSPPTANDQVAIVAP
jgi:hypothetical protein